MFQIEKVYENKRPQNNNAGWIANIAVICNVCTDRSKDTSNSTSCSEAYCAFSQTCLDRCRMDLSR